MGENSNKNGLEVSAFGASFKAIGLGVIVGAVGLVLAVLLLYVLYVLQANQLRGFDLLQKNQDAITDKIAKNTETLSDQISQSNERLIEGQAQNIRSLKFLANTSLLTEEEKKAMPKSLKHKIMETVKEEVQEREDAR